MKLSKAAYDKGQWFIRIFIPAFITLYVGVDTFFNLPKETEVAGVAGLVAVFLGSLLQSSSAQFKRENEVDGGYIYQQGLDPDTGIAGLGLFVNKLPNELLENKTVTLQVRQPPKAVVSQHYPEGLDASPRPPVTPLDTAPPWDRAPIHPDSPMNEGHPHQH